MFDQFLSQHPLGSRIDTDGYPSEQPFQCFDAAMAYMRIVSGQPGLYVSCRSSGYVKDWFNDFATNGLGQWFDRLPWNAQGQYGDIVIWDNAPATPYSHVAILYADNGTSQDVYGQNQPDPWTTRRNITSNGVFGYLRPKEVNNMNDEAKKGIYRVGLHREPENDQVWRAISDNPEQALNDVRQSDEWLTQNHVLLVAYPQAQTDLSAARGAQEIAETRLRDEQQANAIATTTIDSQKQTIADLQAMLASQPSETVPPTQGDAGVTPTPPVDPSPLATLISYIAVWIKNRRSSK